MTEMRNQRGQNVLEYVMVIALVAAAVMAMQVYIRRAMQAHYKMVELQLNDDAKDPEENP